MKKNKIIGTSLIVLVNAFSISALILTSFASHVYPQGVNRRALAEDSPYTMTFNSSDRDNFSYHYLTKSFSKKNYNDEDITFKYKRCRNVSSSYAFAMSPGGYLYNPYISTMGNNNGLFGISSLTVNFTTTSGKLLISYGLDESYIDTNIELTSGVAYEFSSFKPSHFKLYVDGSDINGDNDIYVGSISITYHSNSYYDSQEYTYNEVIGNQSAITLDNEETHSYSLNNTDIGTNNYLNFKYRATGNFTATLNYYDSTNSTSRSEEMFFEENTKVEDFNTFLDNFRKGSTGTTNKQLTSFVIKNVSDASATFTLVGLYYTDRVYSRTDALYISDSSIEVGVSLQFAGAITSVKNLDLNIQEYVDTDYNIKIRGSDKHSGDVNNVIKDNPNLINTYDVGREVQQSWYLNVDSDQGYTREEYNGKNVSYNPVQAGDMHNNESQIVDYKVTYNSENTAKIESIWIKTKALDWAHTNDLSKSYMENYYVVEDGLIKVTNRFIDFSGWTNYETNSGFPQGSNNTNGNAFLATSEAPLYSIQELPAVYTAHPLNYYASFFSDSSSSSSGKLIFDSNQGWNVSSGETNAPVEYSTYLVNNGTYEGENTYQFDLSAYNSGTGSSAEAYHYEFRKHSENWLGFFNEDKFGLAIYMPANEYNHNTGSDRHVFASGMYNSSHEASTAFNRQYLDSDYNSSTASFSKGYTIFGKTYGKTDLTKESCYVNNTGYFTTILGMYIPNYTAIEYSYFIGADYLNTLRSKFNTIQSSGTIDNDFSNIKGALI